jgi:hypothetical protein
MSPNKNLIEPKPYMNPTKNLIEPKPATLTNFRVFGLTRPGLQPTISCTRGEQANHYTTDAGKTLLNNGLQRLVA